MLSNFITVATLALCASAAPTARSTAGPGPVALGESGNFAILAQSGISSIPQTQITGDIGVSPVPQSYITGLNVQHTEGTSTGTSSSVVGTVYAADYNTPTPAYLYQAVNDSVAAYNYAVGLPNPDYVQFEAGNIGGQTLYPGLYTWDNSVYASTDVTISGSPTDTWVFQIAGGLKMASGANIILSGGASSSNIFWAVASGASLGTTSHFEGILSSATAVELLTGASMNGRIYAQTAVTLQKATVTQPGN
ncbi:hypothetical protein P7C70_g4417, partial [Phenoliferia sp. Uapishka_3]